MERNVKVKIDHVEKIYDGRQGKMIALNGVDLDIYENEFICVVGPSGCGKSTLLNIIAGLHEATSGEVLVDGVKVEGTGVDRGVVFQQYALFPWLTVKKNVMFGLKLKGMSDDEAEKIAMKYIKMVQLEDFVDAYPKELSYIMRNAGLKEAQGGIKITGRNINSLRYADDTTLMAESEEKLKSLLTKMKEESEKGHMISAIKSRDHYMIVM